MSTAGKKDVRFFPTFQLKSIDGQVIRESWCQQRPLSLILFYKKDCPTSCLVTTLLKELWRERGVPTDLVLLVSQDGAEKSARTVAEWDLPFPVVSDAPNYRLSKTLDFDAVPTGYLVDPNRQVQGRFTGFVRQEFQQVLETLLGANQCPAPAGLETRKGIPAFSPG